MDGYIDTHTYNYMYACICVTNEQHPWISYAHQQHTTIHGCNKLRMVCIFRVTLYRCSGEIRAVRMSPTSSNDVLKKACPLRNRHADFPPYSVPPKFFMAEQAEFMHRIVGIKRCMNPNIKMVFQETGQESRSASLGPSMRC